MKQRTLSWNDTIATKGCLKDRAAQILIVGGSNAGGTSIAGGEAVWALNLGDRTLTHPELSLQIDTQGNNFLGRGLHSTVKGGAVEIFLNDELFCKVRCEVKGLFADFWPLAAPPGSGTLSTGWLATKQTELTGNLALRIRTTTHTALDIHKIALQFRCTPTAIAVEDEKDVIRILFMAAEPDDRHRLRLGQEHRDIEDQLEKARLKDQFDLRARHALRPVDLSKALLRWKPQIVHFSGHGSRGALILEDESGHAHIVEPDVLAHLFKEVAHFVECVVLNACYSRFQAKAIVRHINYVVGIPEEVEDRLAIAYSVGFYQALGEEPDVEKAHRFGCVQMELQRGRKLKKRETPLLLAKKPAL